MGRPGEKGRKGDGESCVASVVCTEMHTRLAPHAAAAAVPFGSVAVAGLWLVPPFLALLAFAVGSNPAAADAAASSPFSEAEIAAAEAPIRTSTTYVQSATTT